MSDLRTAAQRLLEACEQRLPLVGQANIIDELNDLRDALEQEPEPDDEPTYCPTCGVEDGGTTCGMPNCGLRCGAEPRQEPVAWMYTGIKQDGTEHGPHLVWKPAYMDAMSADKGAKATPLYTAPPQRPPLTDEEIDKATAQERDALLDHIYEYGTAAEGVLERIRKLCRAIERKVRGE